MQNCRLTSVALFAFSIILLLAGCAGDSGSGAKSQAQSANPVVKGVKADGSASQTKVTRSVFTIDQNSRDPFNPGVRKAAAAFTQDSSQKVAALDIPTLLNEGFQGIGGNSDSHIALINNVLLEPGKKALVPLPNGNNKNRSVLVMCREVTRNSVVLYVDGYGEIIVKHTRSL